MSQTSSADQLQQLLEELERGWCEQRDDALVDRLAVTHPEFALELYGFFADIMEAELALDTPRPELAQLDARIRERLAELGQAGRLMPEVARTPGSAAVQSSSVGPVAGPSANMSSGPPRASPEGNGDSEDQGKRFSALLRAYTGQRQNEIASALGLTAAFIVAVSEYSAVVPSKARDELVARAAKAFKLDPINQVLPLRASLSFPATGLAKAASRSGPYQGEAVTFDLIVAQSGLSDEQQGFWLSLR